MLGRQLRRHAHGVAICPARYRLLLPSDDPEADARAQEFELDVFGTRTGKTVLVLEGEPLPDAPQGFN